MAQSLSQVYLHIVFSTKHRQPFLRKEIRHEVHLQLHALSRKSGCETIIVGGVEDHVHMLCRFTRTITIARLLEDVKRTSSLWMKRRYPDMQRFAWQKGYGVFSIGASQVEGVQRYIANQEAHHRRQIFQDEYRGLLRAYGVDYDERYVWD